MQFSVELIEKIVLNMPCYVFWIDSQSEFMGCNDNFAKLLQLNVSKNIMGYKVSEIPWLEFFIQRYLCHKNRALDTKKSITNKKVEININNTGNKEYLINKIPLVNEKNKATYILVTLIDILHQEKVDDKIEKASQNAPSYSTDLNRETIDYTSIQDSADELENYFKSIIAHMPGNVYWLNRDCILQGGNINLANMFGLKSYNELVGLNYDDMARLAHWTEGQEESFKRAELEVMATGIPKLNVEEPPVIINGQKRYYMSNKVPLFNKNQEIKGVLGISLDITERKKLLEDLKHAKELAELANQAKTEFLANMRHDIRTPLTGIIAFAEILKSESHESRIKEYAENLVASSHALLQLMDEVLEAVRISTGEIPIVKKKFDLSRMLKKIMDLYASKASQKKLQLSLHIDEKLPKYLLGDKIRLHRIVMELVGNALNFTDVGQVNIEVTLAKQKDRNLVIKLIVADSGIGIPKDKQQEIYIQFKRLTPAYEGIYKGTGLGLYVVKQFIEELSGEIYVESELNKGTCFTCLIPVQESLLDDDSGTHEDEELINKKQFIPAPVHQIDTGTTSSEEKTTHYVLLVEDNHIAQIAAKAILSNLSCRIDIAADGLQALELFSKNQYDLIFMDIGLGAGIDGYEVTRRFRQRQKNEDYVPIIALTAHGGDENKQRCIEAGMDAVLSKPLTQAQATDILSTFISTQKPKPQPETKPKRIDLPDTDEALFEMEQFKWLDIEEGLKNCGGEEELLTELLVMMIEEELPDDLEKMKAAFENKDYPLVEKIAHKIKGGAVYVGTIKMKMACQYLERYWKTGERDLFEQLYHQAVEIIQTTCKNVTTYLEEKKIK